MEINILEEKKNRMVFEIKGESHTLSNLLRKELWNDEHIKTAAYTLDHPLVQTPRFIIETEGGAEPRKALHAATKRIQKELEKIRSEAKEIK